MTDAFSAAAGRLHSEVGAMLAAPVLSDDDDPLEQLRASIAVQSQATALVAVAVERARNAGRTWQDIGDALGVTRQAAFQRYGKPIDRGSAEGASAAPLPEAEELAGAIIDDLAAGNWSAVIERFDPTMRDQLNEVGLAAAWAHVVGLAGAFHSRSATTVTRLAEFTVTNTPLGFAAGDFNARISFRDDRTIAGLYLLLAEPAP